MFNVQVPPDLSRLKDSIDDKENQNRANQTNLNKVATILEEKSLNIKNRESKSTKSHKLIQQKDVDQFYKLPQYVDKQSLVISDYLYVDLNEIDFGQQLVDTIVEKQIVIKNISKYNLVVRVKVVYQDEQYESMDEYIFSLRKENSHNYNESQNIILSPQTSITYMVALKVPQMSQDSKIDAQLHVYLDKFENKVSIVNLATQAVIPQIVCGKTIQQDNFQVVKLTMRRSVKLHSKIHLKNITQNYKNNIYFDTQIIEDIDQKEVYQLVAICNQDYFYENSNVVVNFIVKVNDFDRFQQITSIRFIFIVSIYDSSQKIPFAIDLSIIQSDENST